MFCGGNWSDASKGNVSKIEKWNISHATLQRVHGSARRYRMSKSCEKNQQKGNTKRRGKLEKSINTQAKMFNRII